MGVEAEVLEASEDLFWENIPCADRILFLNMGIAMAKGLQRPSSFENGKVPTFETCRSRAGRAVQKEVHTHDERRVYVM